jgi:hypothetical protein
MKRATDGEKKQAKAKITKSVAMPSDLLTKVEARLRQDPENDFSKYIRRLVRADINSAA